MATFEEIWLSRKKAGLPGLALSQPASRWMPFFSDVSVGEALYGSDDIDGFVQQLTGRFQALAAEARPKEWS